MEHRWNYKRLFFIVVSILIAILILTSPSIKNFIGNLGNYRYFGAFIAGIFFAFGFTAAPATAAILILAGIINPLALGLIGGLGAMFSDLLIFSYIKYNLDPDLKYIIKKTGIMRLRKLEKTRLRWIIPFIAGFIIASPLPDEIGSFIFGIAKYETKKFLFYSYILNSFGIFIIALIGR